MSFLALLVAMVLFRVWGNGGPVQSDRWFDAWRAQATTFAGEGVAGLAVAVLAPALVAGWLLDALDDALFGLVWFAAAVVLLLYSLGRRDLEEMMARYRNHCRSGDFEGAWLAVCTDLGLAVDPGPEDAPAAHGRIQRAFAYEACQRWFAVLLYFLLLGPAGALAYRLLQLCRDGIPTGPVEQWLFIADWLPSRLMAATFAITGDFVRSRDELLSGLGEGAMPADELLHRVATAAAVEGPPTGETRFDGATAVADNEALEGLLNRSAASWVAVVAVVVLFD
jgi:AmpE protein